MSLVGMDSAGAETAVSRIPGWGAAPCSSGPGYGGSQHPAPPQPSGAYQLVLHRQHQLEERDEG